MANRRKLKLHKERIDDDLYQEFFYYCKRYESRKRNINDLYGLSAVCQDGMPRGSSISNQTESKAMRIEKLFRENELIEQTAIEADSCIYQELIKNVTQGIGFDYLDCPCSRGYFYKKRRRFFELLSERR